MKTLFILMLMVTLAACAEPEPPVTWLDLAQRPPAPLDGSFADALRNLHERVPDSPALQIESVEDGHALWIERSIPPEAWEPTGTPHLYSTQRVLANVGNPEQGAPAVRVFAGDRELSFLRFLQRKLQTQPDTFFTEGDKLFVTLETADGVLPPIRHSVYFRSTKKGVATSRIAHRRFAGKGLSVLPGMREELPLSVTGNTNLRFATVAQGAVIDLGPDAAPLEFQIELDGQPLWSHVQPALRISQSEVAWHNVRLPLDAQGLLSFEVRGPPALTAFLAPTVGPSEIGTPSQRPWGRDGNRDGARGKEHSRPDIVIFLADTFRADNLATYGSTLGLTPNIDAFARGSTRFLNAWSPATWTLPAHASLFSGIFPTQHFATQKSFSLSEEVVTIAEQLAAAGYRTGGITDAMLVSHGGGLAQGFESWDEHDGSLEHTLERSRAFLEADDGRPAFLFVQTYEVHTPYEASDATKAQHGDSLQLEGMDSELLTAIRAASNNLPAGEARSAEVEALIEQYYDLYRGGVVDLDRGFGEFLELVKEQGLGESAYLLFTSDHGEAFDEHGVLGHGTGVFEEHVRIPLLIRAPLGPSESRGPAGSLGPGSRGLRGPALAPGDVSHAASLLDLPRTLSAMAGIEPNPGWLGASLLGPGEDRPVFAHISTAKNAQPPTMAMIDRGRKLIAISADGPQQLGEIAAAYDLDQDPGEQQNLLQSTAAEAPDWVRKLEARLRPMAQMLLRPLVAPNTRTLTAEEEEALRQLGYADF